MWFWIVSALTPITVVGVLSEDGVEACEKGVQRWVNVLPQVGWSSFHGATAPGSLQGKLVQVTGTPAERPAGEAVTNDFTCPPMQMRSDWIRTKSGTRYARSDKAPRQHLEATDVAPFGGLSLDHDAAKETVAITLINPFSAPLVDVTLVLHYEGCYGKPGKLETRRPLGRVEPGGRVAVADLPVYRERPSARGSEHVLAYVQLVSKQSPVLDIDVSPKALGADLRCKTFGKGRR